MAFVRTWQKLSPCLTEPLTALSKTDTVLAKPESISNGNNTSVITYFRRGKHYCAEVISTREERSENM